MDIKRASGLVAMFFVFWGTMAASSSCVAAEEGLVILSSSNYNLLAINGTLAEGTIVVKNTSSQVITEFAPEHNDQIVVSDPPANEISCLKQDGILGNGQCKFNIKYNGNSSVTARVSTPVTLKIKGKINGATETSDSITLNLIDIPTNIFFQPQVDATEIKGFTSSITSFTTCSNNGIEFLYAGTRDSGVFKSSDGGRTWIAVNNNLTNKHINSLCSNGEVLYAGTNIDLDSSGELIGGIYKSLDGGTTWILDNKIAVTGNAINQNVQILYSCKKDADEVLYAGTDGGYVYKNSDDGWVPVGDIVGIITDPNDPTSKYPVPVQTLYSDGKVLYAGSGYGVFSLSKLDDVTASWGRESTVGVVNNICSSPDGTLYVGTSSGVQKRSIDSNGSVSWSTITNPPTGNAICTYVLYDSGFLYVGTPYGVYILDESKKSWSKLDTDYTRNIKVLVSHNGELYAGTLRGGIFNIHEPTMRKDEGIAGIRVKSLCSYGGALYLGSVDNGVFKSDDAGASWISINKGLTNLISCALCAHGADLYVGTNGGIFQLDRSDQTDIKWKSFSGPIPNVSASAVQVLVSLDEILYAVVGNVVYGFDGTKWNRVDYKVPKTLLYVQALYSYNNDLYVGTLAPALGILKFDSTTWIPFNAGLEAPGATVLHTYAGTLYAGTIGYDKGVYEFHNVANDPNPKWNSVNDENIKGLDVHAIESNSGDLYASAGAKVFRFHKIDDKVSWESIGGLANGSGDYVQSLCLDVNNEYLYAGMGAYGMANGGFFKMIPPSSPVSKPMSASTKMSISVFSSISDRCVCLCGRETWFGNTVPHRIGMALSLLECAQSCKMKGTGWGIDSCEQTMENRDVAKLTGKDEL